MKPKTDNYPLQDKLIYDFYLSANNSHVKCKVYTRYDHLTITDHSRVTDAYCIYTANGCVFKDNSQFDRYLNGHYYTLNPDKEKACHAITEYYQQKVLDAQEKTDRYRNILEKLNLTASDRKLIHILSEDNFLLDTLDVENYDQEFEPAFYKYVQDWNDMKDGTDCEFGEYVYNKLKEHGYRFMIREVQELTVNL